MCICLILQFKEEDLLKSVLSLKMKILQNQTSIFGLLFNVGLTLVLYCPKYFWEFWVKPQALSSQLTWSGAEVHIIIIFSIAHQETIEQKMITFTKHFLLCEWILNTAAWVRLEELTVVPDAPKSKRVLHCSEELLKLLIFRLFISSLLNQCCAECF